MYNMANTMSHEDGHTQGAFKPKEPIDIDQQVPLALEAIPDEILGQELASLRPDSQPITLQPVTPEGILFANAGGRANQPPRQGTVGTGRAEQSGGRQPGGMSRRRFLGGLAAAVGALATGGVATYFATKDSGSNTVDKPNSTPIAGGNPNPSAEIPTAVGTTSPTNTPEATASATPTPTEKPVEPTVTSSVKHEVNNPEVRKILERYFAPIGKIVNTYGKVSLGVSIAVQDRGGCEPAANGYKQNCPIHELYAAEEIPDSADRIEKAYTTFMFYNAWNNLRENKPASQSELVVSEADTDEIFFQKMDKFAKRVAGGEDFSFDLQAHGESPKTFTENFHINPSKTKVAKIALPPDGKGTFVNVTDKITTGWSVLHNGDGNDTIIFGSWNAMSEGVGQDDPRFNVLKAVAIAFSAYEIIYFGDKIVNNSLKKESRVNLFNGDYARQRIAISRVAQILLTNYSGGTLPPQTEQIGSIRAK